MSATTRIELNVGLFTSAGPNKPADVKTRKELALKIASKAFGSFSSHVGIGHWEGTAEATLTIVLVGHASTLVRVLARDIAVALEQDSVLVTESRVDARLIPQNYRGARR